jgi:CHAT domain-containing protein
MRLSCRGPTTGLKHRRSAWALAIAAIFWLGDGASALADVRQTIRDLIGQGTSAFRTGDLLAATKAWDEAIRFCRVAGAVDLETETLIHRGETLERLGFVRAAVEDLTRAIELAEASGDVERTAAASGALGNARLFQRDARTARPLLERSLEIATRHGLAAVAAASANNLGNLAWIEGRAGEAVGRFREAAAAADRMGDRALAAVAQVNLARGLLGLGTADEALAVLESARTALSAIDASIDRTRSQIAIGRLAVEAASKAVVGAEALAYRSLREAAIAAEAMADARGQSLALGYLAEFYESQGRAGDALSLARLALARARHDNARDLQYRWNWSIGRLLRATDLAGAGAALRAAVADLQDIRIDVPIEFRDGRSSFRETLGPLFYDLADVLLRQAALEADRQRIEALLEEARGTVELLKSAEIQDYFKDTCAVGAVAPRVTIDEVSPRTAAIYPILLPDRLELLISLPSGRHRTTVPVRLERIGAEARTLRQLLEKRTTREYLPHAQQLYDWLIRPIEPRLAAERIETLVFLPDGPLRAIPLAALHDGERFVIERYAVATAPGLSLVDPQPLVKENPRILIAGVTKPVQGYPGLPNVRDELETIGRLYGSAIVADDDFSMARVEELLRTEPYAVVHIASHGEFSGDPEQSFVLTFDGRLNMTRIENAIKFSQFRSAPLELLTLSACRTAAGDDRAALGLAGVAIKSGARSAVATLWFVSDQASSRLVADFYDRLRNQRSGKARALQEAQKTLLADRRYRHPGYWAPFLLIGNWL